MVVIHMEKKYLIDVYMECFDPLGYDEEGNYGNEWSQSIWISDRGLTSGYLNDILLHESAHAYSFLTLRGLQTSRR